MRLIIIQCILASIGLVARAQLNFKGNPLTENIDYTAEETHFSERNAKRNYESLEIDDGRSIGVSNDQFSSSPNDVVASREKQASRTIDKTIKNERVQNDMQKLSTENEEASGESLFASHEINRTHTGSKPSDTETSPKTPKSQPNPEIQAEARQLREYPEHSKPNSAYRSASSQASSVNVDQSPSYGTLDRSSQLGIPQAHMRPNPAPINSASGQALNNFLNSRTPEESQLALQNYLRIRDQSSYSESALQTGPISNQMPQQEFNSQTPLPAAQSSSLLSDPTGQINYSPAQHAPLRWNQVGFQSRQDSLIAGPGRRPSPYRGQFPGIAGRLRGTPWSQPRIGPGPPLFHHKGPGFAGPPVPPPGFTGKWKQPVQVIYTRPPGHFGGPPNNQLSHDSASHWFPDADGDQAPPQKDILWSQLYAQSYDPHYYNYIAKTGKVKPWLYGKLGEPEEKSIWWELFSGFKRHGMKNIMNPMFLLGMTIPTLTLMLTALVHKRSLGRSFSDGHVTEDLIEEYARQLQEAIECNAKLIRDGKSHEKNRCW